jgi:ubiquinone/menaquinone biosynthesis C-methylase UbiE
MKQFHLPLFGALGGGYGFIGHHCGDELVEGRLVAGGQEVAMVHQGVPIFPSAVCQTYDWLDDSLIAYNWQNEFQNSQDADRARLCDILAAVDGTILEVAAGPGGGNLSPVLRRNHDASIIANDINVPTLAAWREFLKSNGLGPRVSLAAFDACVCPLREGALGAVSSAGGFSSITPPGMTSQAIEEAVRALASGGKLCALETIADPDDLARMSDGDRKALQTSCPEMTRNWGALFESAGLELEWHHRVPGQSLLAGERGWANRTGRIGVTLHLQFEYIIATKP